MHRTLTTSVTTYIPVAIGATNLHSNQFTMARSAPPGSAGQCRTVRLYTCTSSHGKVLTVIFVLQTLGRQIYADYIAEFGMHLQSDASIQYTCDATPQDEEGITYSCL